MIVLTAKQITQMEEQAIEKKALNDSINMTMRYTENRLNELEKERRAWWKEIAEIYGMDLEKHAYEVVRQDGLAQIRKKEEISD